MTILVSDDGLWGLLQSDENDQLDFKSASLLTNPDGQSRYKIAKHITGFANHRGGEIVFGVNDEGEPEGADLIEEECLSTISEISADWCSPSIDFRHDFFSESRGDLSEGSILVLKIYQKRNPPPVAITENSEGKIQKREYRIRSGESTRLVSDGELLSLFQDEHDLEIEKSHNFWYTHGNRLETPKLDFQPGYYYKFSDILQTISENRDSILEAIERETDNEETEYLHIVLFERISCLSILRDLFSISWDRLLDQIKTIEDDRSVSSDYDFVTISSDDILMGDNDDPVVNEFPSEFCDLIEEAEATSTEDKDQGLPIPDGAEIKVTDDFRGIEITMDGEFSIFVNTRPRMTTVGLPPNHPEAGENPHAPLLLTDGGEPGINNDFISHQVDIKIEAEFMYPSQSYDNYVVAQEYAEHLYQKLSRGYNWEEFIENIPNRKFYDIEEKLEDIEDKIDNISE
ncbi:AlbA family DNA-binding domain-containing protein [Haloglomus halophilum]|uniref:AlbA family DNA-binding domain-containing protein n=1 Tax=Haloglomus halophilum TaxID=2962672 RepID=UPI0020CA2206|nr:ATP-binding protein [Haloglomus halophilum]